MKSSVEVLWTARRESAIGTKDKRSINLHNWTECWLCRMFYDTYGLFGFVTHKNDGKVSSYCRRWLFYLKGSLRWKAARFSEAPIIHTSSIIDRRPQLNQKISSNLSWCSNLQIADDDKLCATHKSTFLNRRIFHPKVDSNDAWAASLLLAFGVEANDLLVLDRYRLKDSDVVDGAVGCLLLLLTII